MNSKSKKGLMTLTESSIMIALSTVLSVLPLFKMPYGGSITMASLLPIVVVAYRHDEKVGLGTALVTAMLQMLLGLENFSYFSTWQSLLVLAVLDYVVAFLVFGLSGICRRFIADQRVAMATGATLACLCRYFCHVISGATIWAGLSIPTEAAFIYSLGYNATYMIPETIVLAVAAYYICSAVDFSKETPTRAKKFTTDGNIALIKVISGLSIFVGIIVDTILVFSKLQDAETGDFVITNLANVDWVAFTIVTVVCIGAAVILHLVDKKKENK